jgi:hypothetical protein
VARFGARLNHDLAAAGDNEEDNAQQHNESIAVIWSAEVNNAKCKDFEWYLQTASLGSLIAPRSNTSTQFGILQVG